MDQLVTMIYAVVDPARHQLTLANAGHPAPILLRADGGREPLPLPGAARHPVFRDFNAIRL